MPIPSIAVPFAPPKPAKLGRFQQLSLTKVPVFMASEQIPRIWDFDIDQFKRMDRVMSRNDVYEGKYNGKDVVVKQLPLIRGDGSNVRTMLDREIRIQKKMTIKHPDVVVPLVAWAKCEDQGYAYILTERQDKSLHECLKKDRNFRADKMLVMQTLYGVAKCMAYLHAEFVMHRDLKPENILLGPKCKDPRICDFEFSRRFQTGDTKGERTTDLGSTLYEAPEMTGGKYGPEVDVFSYSIVMYACFEDNPTWEFENRTEAGMSNIHAMITGGKRYVRPKKIEDCFWNLITQCWDCDPHKRPSFEKIMEEYRSIARKYPMKTPALRQFARQISEDIDKFREFKAERHQEMMDKAAKKEAEMQNETNEENRRKLEKKLNLYKRRAEALQPGQKMDSSVFLSLDDSDDVSEVQSDEVVERQK